VAKPPLIVLAGPTASGKTALSIAMAHAFGGEIIAMGFHAGLPRMDIGTAKPSWRSGKGSRIICWTLLSQETRFRSEYVDTGERLHGRCLWAGEDTAPCSGGTGFVFKGPDSGYDLGANPGDDALRSHFAALAEQEKGKSSCTGCFRKPIPLRGPAASQ
jgi:tRNA dimethylallyltransferase